MLSGNPWPRRVRKTLGYRISNVNLTQGGIYYPAWPSVSRDTMMDYTKYLCLPSTSPPQTSPLPSSQTAQVPNDAGGYGWEVNPWDRLDRFLILGSEGGTYYVGERELVKDNARAVQACIDEDGATVVDRIYELSHTGQTARNDACLFVLAMCISAGDLSNADTNHPDVQTRQKAAEMLPFIARTGSQLLQFVHFATAFRGWGRILRRAVRNWYESRDVDDLEFQVLKYPHRFGRGHKQLVRLSHPRPANAAQNALYAHITGAGVDTDITDLRLLNAVRSMRAARSDIATIVAAERLPLEMVPTELRTSSVYESSLRNLGLTALIRNLGLLTHHGVFDREENLAYTVNRLKDESALRNARIHPMSILSALTVYESGGGVRSKLRWSPRREIVSALDSAFYLAFNNVSPAGRDMVVGIDVSGSMRYTRVYGMPHMPAYTAAAAMAIMLRRTEKEGRVHVMAFDDRVHDVAINYCDGLGKVVATIRDMGGGGTDCALPITWAIQRGIKAEGIIILTDSQTWAGRYHPAFAIQEYRRRMNRSTAKLIVLAMAASRVTIADPDDPGHLNVVGLDTAAPRIISDFVSGRLI